MSERLKQIEARCAKLGWDWLWFQEAVSHLLAMTNQKLDRLTEAWAVTAERILSLYEDGPMVDIITELEHRIRERFRAEPDFPIKQIRVQHSYERGWLMSHREIIEYLKHLRTDKYKLVRWGDGH